MAKKNIRNTADNCWRKVDIEMICLYFAAFLTGIFASLGVGGGMILILFLTIFEDADQITAQGINLIYFIPIAILSVIIHTKNKLIEWKKIIPAIITGVAGAIAGTYIAQFIGSPMLSKIFGVFILVIGLKEMFYKPKRHCSSDKQDMTRE